MAFGVACLEGRGDGERKVVELPAPAQHVWQRADPRVEILEIPVPLIAPVRTAKQSEKERKKKIKKQTNKQKKEIKKLLAKDRKNTGGIKQEEKMRTKLDVVMIFVSFLA